MTSEQSSESKEKCACVFDVSLPIELVAGWMDGWICAWPVSGMDVWFSAQLAGFGWQGQLSILYYDAVVDSLFIWKLCYSVGKTIRHIATQVHLVI